MHMVSEKDLNSAELSTMRTSSGPMTVMTADGEVRTNKEATENVKQLDSFVTVMLLQETPAVPSLVKTLPKTWENVSLEKRSESTSHQKRQEN